MASVSFHEWFHTFFMNQGVSRNASGIKDSDRVDAFVWRFVRVTATRYCLFNWHAEWCIFNVRGSTLQSLGHKILVRVFCTAVQPLAVCFVGAEKIFGRKVGIVGVLLALTLSYEAVCIDNSKT